MQIAEPIQHLAVPVDDLTLWDRNPRDADVDAIKSVLEEVGQWWPILYHVKDAQRVVRIGNHRLQAARQLGWTHIAAIDGSALTEEQITAFALADNQLNLLGTNRTDVLAEHLATLQATTPALVQVTGFTNDAVEALLQAAAATDTAKADPVAVEANPDDATSRTGDLWRLGPHRLIVGRSDQATAWDVLLEGQPAPATIWTDPPYGVAYVGGSLRRREILNDDLSPEQLEEMLGACFEEALNRSRPGATWWVCSPSGPAMNSFSNVLHRLQVWRQIVVWTKDQQSFGRSDYQLKHELIFWGGTPGKWAPDATFGRTEHELIVYGWSPNGPHTAPDDRRQTTLLQFDRPKTSPLHPTQKPVDLVEYCLGHSKPGPVVDPYAGSGTTMVAAHRNGRRCFMVERDVLYADVICRRWQDLTGELPERDGQPVNFIPEPPGEEAPADG